MNWICGGLGLFTTGTQQELGALYMPPVACTEDCSPVFNISMKHERSVFVRKRFLSIVESIGSWYCLT